MNKLKFAGIASLIAGGALLAVSMAGAQTTALSVNCSASISGNVITWTAAAANGTAPYTFAWTGDSHVAGSVSNSIVASYTANGTYTAGIRATDASSTVATSTCFGTVTSIVTTTSTPPVTPPVTLVMKPSLSIGENGQFLSRGMRVTSVGTGSFQAQVWGITYTVNWSGNLNNSLEFFFRFNKANVTSTVTQQLSVGDEVGVAGRIDPSSPLVVNANVVRDYSIVIPRPVHENDEGQGNGDGNGKGNGIGEDNSNGNGHNGNGTSSGIGGSDAQGRLNDLLKQLKGLQDLFRSRSGSNGGGNGDH